MKALYVNPPLWVPSDPIDYPPFAFVGALHGAAALRGLGVEVQVYESFAQVAPSPGAAGWLRLGPSVETTLAALAGAEASLVVVHFSPFAHLERNLREVVAPLLKGLAQPGRTLALADGCLGETHYVTADPAWLFNRFPELDALLIREPEKPLEALVTNGDHVRLFRRDAGRPGGAEGQVARWHSPLEWVDLERTVRWLSSKSLAPLMPDYDGQHRIFPYVASRGCPYQCRFCTSEPGRRFAGQPLERVRADLARLADHGVQQIWLLDAIANANRKRFTELLGCIDELDLQVVIPNGLRMDRLDRPALDLLARRSRRVPMSLESADPEVLASLGKKLSPTRAQKTLAEAADAGLSTQVHYIIGAPGETAAQVNRTLAFAFEARRKWGAEPLVQYYVSPGCLAVPVEGDQGLGDDFYEAFLRQPPAAPPGGGLDVGQLRRFMDSFERRLAAPRQSKLIVNLSYRCNNECVFCSVGDRDRVDGRLQDQLEALEQAAARGVRLLDLDGGEPTLYPALLQVVDRARELGFETITVTTNGRMLGYEDLAARLARRDVALLVSLHGASAAVHEPLTRAPGSFEQTLAGIRRAREVFGRLGVNTTVVADNLADLPALGRLLVSLGVDTWNVQLLTPFGHAIARADLAPDWDEAVDALRGLRERFADSLRLQLVGLPLCGLGEHESLGLDDHHKGVRQMLFVDGEQVSLGAYLDERRAHDAACRDCPRLLLCGGYWDFVTPYTDRHRGGPTPTATPTISETGGPHEAPPALPEPAADSPSPAVRMLDIIPGYACNVVCDYCSVTEEMRQVEMSFSEILPTLEQGREQSIEYVSFGGGEPTIRPDILRLTRAAQRLGYATIRYQTNGFLFAYPDFTQRAVDAGLNRLHLSLMTSRAELYDRITGFDDSRKIVLQALRNLRRQPVTLVADLILKSDTYRHIRETVAFYAEQGVREAYLWLVSLTDRNADNVDSLVPVSDMRPYIIEALEYGREHGLTVMSRHIPACMLPGYEDQVVRLGDEDVWVVTPRSSFWLLESVISANRFSPRCDGCLRKGICWGLREDYLARYGDAEVQPYGRTTP